MSKQQELWQRARDPKFAEKLAALEAERERAYIRYLRSLPRPADPYERD